MSIDLTKLPAPAVVESLNFETILATIKADVIANYPDAAATLQLESEPITKLIEVFAYRELMLRARINDAARSVMLAYAVSTDLDHLAALVGVSRLDGETDDRLRYRTQLSLEGFSTAGPVLSYVFHALSASNQVKDVYVHSPIPGDVRVVVLATPSTENPGGVPAAGLLAAVGAALNAGDIRPLCDTVSTLPATVSTYTVAATLTCTPGPDTAVVLAAAVAAIESYTTEQFRLGYDITVSGIHAALHQPGVMRVDLTSPPASIVISSDQAARCVSIDVSIAGVGV
ncbi:baseplate J/gp47 family protein [uncultured Azonexus sp.]|uniref:baseplate assembly protein n=1 Tax=uncultured Azonexus sp. TaxID=520307 RepID=UPI00260B6ACD|nr:baseplate J/gp47 family protein [uncultured Azonexus sp.]